MNKYMIIGIGVVIAISIIIVIVILCPNFISSQNHDKGKIDFHMLNSYKVDTRGICKKLRIAEDSPFTCFLQITNFENLSEYFAKEFDFEIPEIDFNYQDKYMAITFGRELKEMEYEFLGYPYKPNTIAKADITFSEEYDDKTMYVYVMDKIFLKDSLLDGNSFYIMNGTEKELRGHNITDLNERTPFGGSGL